MIEAVDVDCQARGLNHAAVGPAVLVEGQATSTHQTAANVVEDRRINGESAAAGMQYLATRVLEAARE